MFLIFLVARRKAVRALQLHPGATVLEIGAGTGRNLDFRSWSALREGPDRHMLDVSGPARIITADAYAA